MLKRGIRIAVGSVVAIGAVLALGRVLSDARENARRKKCGSNLKSLGCAFHVYSTDFKDQFPPSLGCMYPRYAPGGTIFRCPTAYKAIVFTEADLGPDAFNAHLLLTDKHSDYKYIPGLSATHPPWLVLMYEPPSNHAGEGSNVVFLDDHVEWLTPAGLQRELQRTYDFMRKNGIPVPAGTR